MSNEQGMFQVSNVTYEAITSSKYIKPTRMHFVQNSVKKAWDFSESMDATGALIFNTTKNVFILVKQFRPPVYFHHLKENPDTKHPGVTLELCAGLCDKSKKSPIAVCKEEILEETGYQVEETDLQSIGAHFGSVAKSTGKFHLFFCNVTEAQKVAQGGGLIEEGEFIQVVELPVQVARDMVEGNMHGYETNPSMMYALAWWFYKYGPK